MNRPIVQTVKIYTTFNPLDGVNISAEQFEKFDKLIEQPTDDYSISFQLTSVDYDDMSYLIEIHFYAKPTELTLLNFMQYKLANYTERIEM